MPGYETLLWDQEGHVVTITLNRPEKKNAVSWQMFEELGAAFGTVADAADVRVVVLTGAGDAFCSGADLTDPANVVSSGFELKERMARIHQIMRSVQNCPKPTIAKINGIAAGGGCSLAMSCDFLVASPDARFAELFVKRGLVVDMGGTWALARLLPLHRAKELAFLGDTIDAAEADRLGLLNRLCEPGELDVAVKDLADRLCALPPRTLSLLKENLNRATERSMDENFEAESLAQAVLYGSEDTREAVLAFIEKREPRFTGR